MPPPSEAPQPGSIGRRFVALLVDGLVLTVLQLPVSLVMRLYLGAAMAAPGMSGDAAMNAAMSKMVTAQFLSIGIGFAISFFYHAWFYSNRGATPGKMLMGLRVVDAQTGANLSWGKTLLRETIGRWVDALAMVLFFAGVLIPIFRRDKRALHDFVAGTQVLQR